MLVRPATTLAIVGGAVLGLGLYTFQYAKGFSYFSTDPQACANCHIMREQYDSWRKSTHHAAARCIDCHLPHSLVPKYVAKGVNGWNHSRAFTMQDFHEPIQITPMNSAILERNCRHCHEALVAELAGGEESGAEAIRCVGCHRSSGHGP